MENEWDGGNLEKPVKIHDIHPHLKLAAASHAK